MQAVNLKEKLATFDDIYVPKIVAELNGRYVKLVKFEGAYPWHSHANEDEMFLVVEGEFDLEFRDRTVFATLVTSSTTTRSNRTN